MAKLSRRDGVAHEDVLDEVGGDALIADVEDERRYSDVPITFSRGFGGRAERVLRVGPRHA